jgi:hypothetical protein
VISNCTPPIRAPLLRYPRGSAPRARHSSRPQPKIPPREGSCKLPRATSCPIHPLQQIAALCHPVRALPPPNHTRLLARRILVR